jgi:lysophospholipase L1-like esterase
MKRKTVSNLVPGARLFACTLVACASALAVPLVAHAAGTAAYVALGDSYTSGPLTGIPTSLFCFQSNNNYPHLVAAAIQPASFADVSCAGAVTKNMTEPQTNGSGLDPNPPQFDALTPNTTLVTVGIGANDAGLVNDVLSCFGVDLLSPTGSACMDQYTVNGVNQISQLINETAPKLAAVYQGIHARSPHARVLAVGYPAVLPVNGTGCWPLTPISPDDVSFLASMFVEINEMIATVAAANDVQYVDTYTPTIGYDVCQAIGHAGFTALLPTTGISFPLHPDALGEQLMANAVLSAIDNPPVATPTAQTPSKPDLKLTRVRISGRAVIVRGTISPSYRGRVTVALNGRYRADPMNLHRSAVVKHGRWRTTVYIPRRYGDELHTGRLTASSRPQSGLTAGAAHVQLHFRKRRP